MKKSLLSLVSLASALILTGCAKETGVTANEDAKRYFDAWMGINHPGIAPSGLGIYIIEDEPGTGKDVETDGYVLMDYIITDLEGNISTYTAKETAKQLGQYDTSVFYGAKFMTTTSGTLASGLAEALKGMKTGGHRKVIVPSWLMTYSVYDTAQEYLANSSSGSNTIYDITVRDFTADVIGWQKEKIGEYFEDHRDIFGSMTAKDTIAGHSGFYYKSLLPGKDTLSFPTDTTIYINYTGRLLNGLVFDTTDEKRAKDNGIWSSSKTYEPVSIKWGEEYTDITMGSGSSSVISGFALTLWQMHAFEKGIGVFTSDYGYGYSGSGSSIPGYSPLIFEIEIVAEPED